MAFEILVQAKKGNLVYGLLNSAVEKGDDGAEYYSSITDDTIVTKNELTAVGLLYGVLQSGGRLMPGSGGGSYKITTDKLPPKQMAILSEMGLGTGSCGCEQPRAPYKIAVYSPPALR